MTWIEFLVPWDRRQIFGRQQVGVEESDTVQVDLVHQSMVHIERAAEDDRIL